MPEKEQKHKCDNCDVQYTLISDGEEPAICCPFCGESLDFGENMVYMAGDGDTEDED